MQCLQLGRQFQEVEGDNAPVDPSTELIRGELEKYVQAYKSMTNVQRLQDLVAVRKSPILGLSLLFSPLLSSPLLSSENQSQNPCSTSSNIPTLCVSPLQIFLKGLLTPVYLCPSSFHPGSSCYSFTLFQVDNNTVLISSRSSMMFNTTSNPRLQFHRLFQGARQGAWLLIHRIVVHSLSSGTPS